MFIVILFVLEPLILHRWFVDRAKIDSVRTLTLVHRFPVGGAGAESRDHCWIGRGQPWLVLGLDKTSRCVLVREGVRIGSAV